MIRKGLLVHLGRLLLRLGKIWERNQLSRLLFRPSCAEKLTKLFSGVMATLSTNEKQILEKLFQMESGYVLNFSDRSFAEFFRDDVGANISAQQYSYISGSKANRLRRFWQVTDDQLVGKSIDKLLDYINGRLLSNA